MVKKKRKHGRRLKENATKIRKMQRKSTKMIYVYMKFLGKSEKHVLFVFSRFSAGHFFFCFLFLFLLFYIFFVNPSKLDKMQS